MAAQAANSSIGQRVCSVSAGAASKPEQYQDRGVPFPFQIECLAGSQRSTMVCGHANQSAAGLIPPTGRGFHPDDTTSIPRHSCASTGASKHRRSKDRQKYPRPARAKRRRDKSPLRFIALQPCVVCGRRPSDPHHLRFAQPRALGVKASDEFTVPLCRGHHRQLHQAGSETAWWDNLKIDALRTARQFWDQTHPSEATRRNKRWRQKTI